MSREGIPDNQPPRIKSFSDLLLLNKLRGGKGLVDRLVGAKVEIKIKSPLKPPQS